MNPKTVLLFLAILLTIHVSAQYRLKDLKGYSAVKINSNLLTAAESSETDARNNKSRDLFWFNMGLGGSGFGLAGLLSFSYQHKSNVISLRRLVNSEISLFSGSDPSELLSDNALLYGIVREGSMGKITLSAGLAFVEAIKRGDKISSGGGWFSFTSKYEKEYDYAIGFPVEVQVFAAPFSFMGVGLYLFGNYNSIHPFSGIILSLQFGRLK